MEEVSWRRRVDFMTMPFTILRREQKNCCSWIEIMSISQWRSLVVNLCQINVYFTSKSWKAMRTCGFLILFFWNNLESGTNFIKKYFCSLKCISIVKNMIWLHTALKQINSFSASTWINAEGIIKKSLVSCFFSALLTYISFNSPVYQMDWIMDFI